MNLLSAITSITNLQKPINRSSFDQEVNQILVKASAFFQKYIRCHSFRPSIINDLLKDTPIDCGLLQQTQA